MIREWLDAAQQLVDAYLAECLGVDFLDDDRAVQAVAAVFGWQVAGNDDGAGWHAAVENFTGFAVVDLGGLADINPHGDHAVVFNDDAFDYFGTGADKAVVADDGGTGLDRFQHAADAD